MKIAINGDIVNTKHIYRITDIINNKNGYINLSFRIEFF
jgi:hypothetical protein